MIHRFMIVCWSLFGTSVATILLGLTMYQSNRRDALDIAYTWQLEAVEMDAIYEELAQMLERGYERYAAALKKQERLLQGPMDTATAKVIAQPIPFSPALLVPV